MSSTKYDNFNVDTSAAIRKYCKENNGFTELRNLETPIETFPLVSK